MNRTRLALLAAALVTGGTFALAAPPASACAGELCDSICAAWANKTVQKVVGSSSCPIA